MTTSGGVFIAPSGNVARVTLTTIGNRTSGDIGWSSYPPSDEDVAACNRAIQTALGAECMGNEFFSATERERCERSQREFLGGGKG